MTDATGPKQYHHLEVQSLSEGGYVVREGMFHLGEYSRHMLQQEVAAFSSLDEALKWIGKHMIRKVPVAK